MAASCKKRFTVVVDGAHRSSVCTFLHDNREGLAASERRKILALKPGQTYRGGGGAWAEWSVRRIKPRR